MLTLHAPRVHAQEYGKPNTETKKVALVALILEPQKFHKVMVQLAGVFYWHPEGSYLFLNGESYIALDRQSAIEIASGLDLFPGGVSPTSLAELNGRVVWIEGLVDATPSAEQRPMISEITWLRKVN